MRKIHVEKWKNIIKQMVTLYPSFLKPCFASDRAEIQPTSSILLCSSVIDQGRYRVKAESARSSTIIAFSEMLGKELG